MSLADTIAGPYLDIFWIFPFGMDATLVAELLGAREGITGKPV
jgi:hypothetical protein